MPLQRRLPKRGFASLSQELTAEVRLHELARIPQEVIDLASLKEAKIVPQTSQKVKVIASGSLSKAVKVKGLAVTRGARAAIEAAGGSIED
jgi:large subunit ribosomal protein L15